MVSADGSAVGPEGPEGSGRGNAGQSEQGPNQPGQPEKSSTSVSGQGSAARPGVGSTAQSSSSQSSTTGGKSAVPNSALDAAVASTSEPESRSASLGGPKVDSSPSPPSQRQSEQLQPVVQPTQPERPDEQPTPSDSKKSRKPKKVSRKQRRINKLVMEFQPDAVEMEHRKVAGGLRWTLYAVILLLIATICWSIWAEVDRQVTAEGKLIAVESFVINAPQTSPILNIEVKFGDTVYAGQALVTLDPTFSDADVKKIETRNNNLSAVIARLVAEQNQVEFSIVGHEDDPVWNNQQILFLKRKRKTSLLVQQYAAEHRKLIAKQAKDEADVKAKTDLVKFRLVTLQKDENLLRKGAATPDEVRTGRAELANARSNLIVAESTVRETIAQFDVLKTQQETTIAEQQAEVSLELAAKRQEFQELVEDLNKAHRSKEYATMYAPNDYEEYKVVEIADTASVVSPGQPIMKLIPIDAPLEVEVKVDSKDIALIRNSKDGEPKQVNIKVSAFPYMTHGTLKARIKTINEDITEEGQPGMSRAFYYVRIKLDDAEDNVLRDTPDANHRLRPGMAVTADIKCGRRRVIDYFIYPLWRSLDTSIREY